MAPVIELVTAGTQDEATLWRMLTYAASMAGDGPDQIAAAQRNPDLVSYAQAWGTRPGDLGFIARDAAGDDLGAAWLRLGEGAFKLSDARVPELAMGVVPEARGRGVGRRLLEALITAATPRYPGIVLSVRASNPAVRLYERCGFVETGRMTNRVGGDSITMRLALPRG
jgi:ribosomal protein S18 acetylase RimI-like enzyme